MFQIFVLWAALVAGGFGIGLFSLLLMERFAPRWIPERVFLILAVTVGGAAVWFQQSSGAPLGGFLVVSGICWVLDVVAGLAIFVVVPDKPKNPPG